MKDFLKINLFVRKLFDIVSLSSKKTLISSLIYGVIAIVLIAGVLFYNIAEKQISSQKAMLANLQQKIKNNNEQIDTLNKKNASESAQITALLDQPTPTPAIEYKINTVTKTQYVSVPENTYVSAPAAPVTYIRAGSELMGSNGSSCIMAGSELDCSGGR